MEKNIRNIHKFILWLHLNQIKADLVINIVQSFGTQNKKKMAIDGINSDIMPRK